jgi:hypothetical protein
MQQQIEFEATTFQHTVRIPDDIPNGLPVRVILVFDDSNNALQKTEEANLNLASKFSPFPAKLTLTRDEINARRPEYLTMAVDAIDIPPRNERYER